MPRDDAHSDLAGLLVECALDCLELFVGDLGGRLKSTERCDGASPETATSLMRMWTAN